MLRWLPAEIKIPMRLIAQWAVFMFVAFCWLPYKQWLERRSGAVRQAERSFVKALRDIAPRTTRKPVVVLMVGLIGSGKTQVARVLADELGAVLLEGSEIYQHFERMHAREGSVRRAAEEAALVILKQGGNVIIDRDNVGWLVHSSFRLRAKVHRLAEIYTIRTTADMKKMLLRVATGQSEHFATDTAARLTLRLHNGLDHIAELSEFFCRAQLHYVIGRHNGMPVRLRKLPFPVFATIDTTTRGWREEAKKAARRIKQSSGETRT